MSDPRRIRRITKYGWSIETSDGDVSAIRLDAGTILVDDRLMGTREAARYLGVQPSNFVRDWASHPDFPAPLAALSSGRVWLAADVERYASVRRSPKPDDGRIDEIARRVVWWQEPARTRARPLEFVARVMALGSFDDMRDVERAYGVRILRGAMSKASPGVFDRRSWNYWLLVLGLERTMPLPARHVP